MANNMMDMDLAYPDLSKYQTTEEKLTVIQDYLYLLLENLRYALRNLNMADNFNQNELQEWVDGLNIVAKSIWTDELYADYGMIADLCVDRLRTDYMRAQRYLDGNTSNIDYITIQDEEISFYTGKVKTSNGEALTEHLHYWGRSYYWMENPATTPRSQWRMTYTEITAWPVIVYQYDDNYGDGTGVRPKATIRFQQEIDRQGNIYKVPVFTFGQGTDPTKATNNGQGRLVKHTDGLELSYLTSAGKRIGVYQEDSGYMDLVGVRRTTELNFSHWGDGSGAGYFTEIIEGSAAETVGGPITRTYGVQFTNGLPTLITYPDGNSLAIDW